MSSRPTVMIVLAALVGIVFFVTLARPSRHILRITCYFQNANGLKVGAPVALAGVEVGSVTSLRVRPELREHPAEVMMLLRTPYELKIPNDSMVALQTAGVFGDTFPEIEVKTATGPPVEDGGTLKTREAEGPTMQQLLECLSNIAEHKPCKGQAKTTK